MYSSDGTNVYGSRGGEFAGIRSVYHVRGLKAVKSCSYSPSLVHTYVVASQHVSFSGLKPQCTASQTICYWHDIVDQCSRIRILCFFFHISKT